MAEPLQQLRDLLAGARWEAAAELLRRMGTNAAADTVLSLPFRQQRLLFRNLPADLAAALVGLFPYFHAYVLLYSLTPQQIAAIVDAMSSPQRTEFLDALPEESWQSLMNIMEEARLGTPSGPTAPEAAQELAPSHADLQPIIEARQISKSYQQPEGREIQVVAPLGRAEHDSRASGSFGFRQVHGLEDAFRVTRAVAGRSALAWQAFA